MTSPKTTYCSEGTTLLKATEVIIAFDLAFRATEEHPVIAVDYYTVGSCSHVLSGIALNCGRRVPAFSSRYQPLKRTRSGKRRSTTTTRTTSSRSFTFWCTFSSSSGQTEVSR